MNEKRLRKIQKVIKERDMILWLRNNLKNNEDWFGRLVFLDHYGVDSLTTTGKILLVAEERLRDAEDYLKHLFNDKD